MAPTLQSEQKSEGTKRKGEHKGVGVIYGMAPNRMQKNVTKLFFKKNTKMLQTHVKHLKSTISVFKKALILS